MTLKLSTLAATLGVAYALPQLYAFANPKGCGEALRKFPRSVQWGYALITLATVWFLYYVKLESIADFAAYKKHMMIAFGAIGVGACFFLKDFLAVRGLAVVLLLLAKLMVDTGRPHLGESPWILVNQSVAYVLVLLGVWLTISPWRLRDWIDWNTADDRRLRIGAVVRMAGGLGFAALGLFIF
ncbi:MAG: hypothetical protein MUC91_00985 [Verrucomicrobia bacterium]|jgi:hypothetical protein|nr:hypothetical protein [Verrucomicrobiota bacterium]